MRAADPAVNLRAQAHAEKAHDELNRLSTGTVLERISGQHEDEESKDKRSRQLLKRGSLSRKERKKQRRAPDPAQRLRAKADAAAHRTSSSSAAGEVDRGGLGSAQRHQDDQGGRRDGEQHVAQKRSRG